MINWRMVTFEPLDVLVNADARGIAEGGYAHEGEIFPAAFAGVVRTEILRRAGYRFRSGDVNDAAARAAAALVGHEATSEQPMTFRFAGPMFATAQGELQFPLPRVYRAPSPDAILDPSSGTHVLADAPLAQLTPLMWTSATGGLVEPGGAILSGLVDGWTLAEWLAGQRGGPLQVGSTSDVVRQERRWGHVRAEGGAAMTGGLFSRGALRFHHGAAATGVRLGGCYAGLLDGVASDVLPDGAFAGRLAGEGRLVNVEVRPDADLRPLCDARAALAKAIIDSRRALLYLATPALFEEGWRPAAFERAHSFLRLIGAAVGLPFIVAGWDFKAIAPKAPKRAVPAGSVYYFEVREGTPLAEIETLLEDYHGAQSVSEWDGALGFGLGFIGTW